MKALFVWPGFTGYMGDAWRELSKRCELKVIVEGEGLGRGFGAETMDGIDWERAENAPDAAERTRRFAPDAMVLVGWNPTSRAVAAADSLASVPKLMQMDLQWEWTLRKLLARWALRPHVRRFGGILVHGASGAKYAKWLGFSEERIFRGCAAAVDVRRFAAESAPERSGFLFVGRRVPAKAVDILERAYSIYRSRGGKWNLSLYGDGGEMAAPAEMPRIMARNACLVLPSRWEPFGMVVVEAKASGMKVIASDRVGAADEMPVDAVVPAGDANALALAMENVEKSSSPPVGGDISYWGVEAWSARVLSALVSVSR